MRALCDEWNIAHATATRAIAALQSEGLIETRQGVGSFVSTARTAPTARQWALNGRRGRYYLPVSTSTSWLPGDLAESAPGLLHTERLQEGTLGYLEARTGRTAVEGIDQY